MHGRSASPPLLPPNVAAGVVVIDVAAASAAGAGPSDLIKVAPRGRVTCRDGRCYSFDPEKLVARFAADGVDLPLDLDHAISRKPLFGDRADAVGWIKELQAREDGIYARPEWLASGRAALDGRTHRYVSPTFHHDEAGNATWLHSVALVAAPALAMPAVADANHTQEPTMIKAIAQALGLNEAASEAACLAALDALKKSVETPDPAKFVKKELHDQAIANLSAATRQLDDIRGAARRAEVEALIEGALKDKKIVPAQKESLTAQCSTDEGLAQVKAFIAATPAGLQASALDSRRPEDGGAALTADELAVCTAMGLEPKSFQAAKAAA
jgi:phage I-like protein